MRLVYCKAFVPSDILVLTKETDLSCSYIIAINY